MTPEWQIGKIFRPLVLAAAMALGGCVAVPRPTSPAAAQASTWILDRLYLGRNIPRGGEVSDEQWAQFLGEIVTPRFPGGFTVLSGNGQWQEKSGTIAHERSFVLELLHPNDAVTESAVSAVAAEYKRRFAQEAVLRVREQVDASF